MKPLLNEPPLKRTPSIKRTLSRVPKLTSYISLYNKPLFSDTDTKISFIWLISVVKNLYLEDTGLNSVTIVVVDYVLEIRTEVSLT